MNTRKARIAELTKLIAAEEISIANGATPQLDDDGNVIVDMATCGTCHTSWNDALITGRTPAPSARCPYEYIHAEIAELKALTNRSRRTPKQLEAFAKMMNAGRTNLARARKVLTRDELFFYEHGGYSYDPKTESADEGRVRCAREMAKAEAFVKGQEYEYEWEYDESGCSGCECDSPDCKCSTGEEHETLCVCLFNPRDRVTHKYATLASLGGICGADANYTHTQSQSNQVRSGGHNMAQLNKVGSRNTTIVRKPDGVLRVTYHSTDVVTVHANGTITLDTGGWKTVTTKTRMNQASNQFGLGYSVHQDDFAWFVTTRDEQGKVISQFCFDGNVVTFNPKTGRKSRSVTA